MLNKMRVLVVLLGVFLAADSTNIEGSDKAFEKMKSPEIIEAHGYPVETYELEVKAGYILTIHRIPYGRNSPKSEDKKVVYLQHALLCSSANWLITGPEKGLGFVLADNGYDVWMPNMRGNRYSRKHVKYTIKDPEFWDFSWHQFGADDMPEIIDFILEKTGKKKLFYIGHSQGTTQYWVFNSIHHNYTDKIIAMFALGPIAYLEHSESPFFQGICTAELLSPDVKSEFVPGEKLINEYGSALCTDNQAVTPEICGNILFPIMGYDDVQINKSNIHILIAHTPSGQSFMQIYHYCQSRNNDRFAQYDYRNKLENKKRYGSFEPPEYDLSKVKAPVHLYYGENDWLAAPKDRERLKNELGNVAEYWPVPFELYNHIDFIIAKDNDKHLHPQILKAMKNYD